MISIGCPADTATAALVRIEYSFFDFDQPCGKRAADSMPSQHPTWWA
jgi:hypothetical protein